MSHAHPVNLNQDVIDQIGFDVDIELPVELITAVAPKKVVHEIVRIDTGEVALQVRRVQRCFLCFLQKYHPARVLEVTFESGEGVIIPRANVELIEGTGGQEP